MALHVKSSSSGNPANSLVSVRHASATSGQKRLIRLRAAANDNPSPHLRWIAWLSAVLAITVVIVLASTV